MTIWLFSTVHKTIYNVILIIITKLSWNKDPVYFAVSNIVSQMTTNNAMRGPINISSLNNKMFYFE